MDTSLSDSDSMADSIVSFVTCYDVETPDVSGNITGVCTADCSQNISGNEDYEQELLRNVGYSDNDIVSAFSNLNSVGENDFGRDRPKTHVYFQGKSFTYPKLEVPKPKNLNLNKDRRENLSVQQVNSEAQLSVSKNPANHHSLNFLGKIRVENVNNVIIGQLNINSLRNKFCFLKEIIHGKIDILVLTETKLDSTFPESQFCIPGYKIPYRRDRDGYGGGVMIYVRGDIPSDILLKHRVDDDLEAIFVEINLRKSKILLIGTYNSCSQKYRKADEEFFKQIAHALDVYSGYDKFLLCGDLNINDFNENEALDDFLDEFHAKNIVKDPTCYSNPENPSCLDLYITNSYRSFQKTSTLATGLSDCHKMVITVLKTTFPKAQPRIVTYRDYSTYCPKKFGENLQQNLSMIEGGTYQPFHDVFLKTLQMDHPEKQKTVRANHKEYCTKEMRKGIMDRSRLQRNYWKHGTEASKREKKKQENYCNKLYKKERKNYYKNLDPRNIEDERKFWLTIKPFFGDKNSGIREKITLVENGQLIDDDDEVAETFNAFFANSVSGLGIMENKLLLNPVKDSDVGIEKCIKMYETHPSIINIKRHVKVDHEFHFLPVAVEDMEKQIAALNPRKNGGCIPTRIIKDMRSVIGQPLSDIWNKQCVLNKTYPSKLQLGDITPVFKALEKTLKKNYRPITVLGTISKLFEKIMDEQTDKFMDEKLSKYVCGYRKGGYNPQLTLTHMIEKMKRSLDKGGHAGAVLMDLSKAFDTINHELLIAKLNAYGFSRDALELIHSYLNDRWHRTKINNSYSSWRKITTGMPQGSVNGPKWFNLYINDLFYLFINTEACNIADDTTPFVCHMDVRTIIRNLESDVASALMWFDANYMKSNQTKCHFILPSTSPELFWIRVGEQVIWESQHEKLLGLGIDKQLKFHEYVKCICKKASAKVTALARLIKVVPLERKRVLFYSFVKSQFQHCPLVWMFNLSRVLNNRINRIHERGLRIVYEDYTTSYEELLKKDGSVKIHHRNIQLVAEVMFKVKNGLCPELMKCLFQMNPDPKAGQQTFYIPRVDTVYMGKLSLSYFGPVVWEKMLPQKYKDLETLYEFKEEIKKWVPDCKCRLCENWVKGVGKVETS